MSYNAKVYFKQGAAEMVVASGGKITVESDGEIDIEAGGVLKVEGEAITADGINNAVESLTVAEALVGAMVAGYGETAHDADAAAEVLEANDSGDGDRAVLIVVKCTESLAGTTKPIFEIGDGDDDDAFAKIGEGGNPSTLDKGAIATFAGVLAEEKPIKITVTDGATGEAGAIEVFVIALPAATS